MHPFKAKMRVQFPSELLWLYFNGRTADCGSANGGSILPGHYSEEESTFGSLSEDGGPEEFFDLCRKMGEKVKVSRCVREFVLG